ncbi:MAG: hypothetical protein ACE5GU_14930 [Candidatus Scalinduaceae bacterium]
MIFSSRTYADTLRLANFDEEIDAKIIEVSEEFVEVIIPQKEIRSISMKSELPVPPTGGDDKFPDTVSINVNGKEDKVVCKIVKITKKPGSITLRIPKQKVSAIQITFPGSDQDKASKARKEGGEKVYSSVDPEILKEQIMEALKLEFEKKNKQEKIVLEKKLKDKLRREFEKKQDKEDVATEKIKEELRLEFEEKKQLEEKAYEAENFGDVRGRMLFKGKPLARCQVKIVMLEKWGFLKTVKEGIRFETVTGDNGRYHFEKVPPGGYKLYWKPPAESSWIRRMRMEPDIYVEVGETSYFPDRETNVRTVN